MNTHLDHQAVPTGKAPAAHTPGPWTAFYKPKYDEWHVSLPLPGQSMRLGLFPDGCPTERAEADAHLIAAAPAGLALARAVAAHFEGTDAPLGQQARDFIAQATGSAA